MKTNWIHDYIDLAQEIEAEGRSQWESYVLAVFWFVWLRSYAQAWDAAAERGREQ